MTRKQKNWMRTYAEPLLYTTAMVGLLGGALQYAKHTEAKEAQAVEAKLAVPTRVNVCVLNHNEFPERQAVIDSALHTAAAEYQTNANIILRKTEQGVYSGNIDELIDEKPTNNPLTFCTQPADIAVIFTMANSLYSCERDGCYRVLGQTDRPHSYVIQYGVAKDSPREHTIHRESLLHELGHVFGLVHSEEPRSFMREKTAGNNGWTQGIVRDLNQLKLSDSLVIQRTHISDSIYTKSDTIPK